MTLFINYLSSNWVGFNNGTIVLNILWLTISYYILLVIYRLTIHPLAKYPGRFVDKISVWSLIRECLSGRRHLLVKSLHDKHGPIIRIAPNMLSFNTATAMYAIYGNPKANVQKAEWYKTLDAGSGDFSTQTIIDKKEHAIRRRIMSPAFSDKALRDAEKYINVNVMKLMQQLGESSMEDGWTKPKNFSDWSTYYSFDFISDLSFGSSLGLINEEENRYIPAMLMGTSKFIYYAGYLPFAPIMNKLLASGLLSYIPDKAAQDTMKFFKLSKTKLEEREALENKQKSSSIPARQDIFHYLLNSRDPITGKGFTKSQLHADSGLLIAAGSDGVAIILSAALFYLLSNPSTLEALNEEVRSNFTSLDNIAMPKLGSLHYLQAVIDETMRMTPPVPSALPRRVLPGGLIVDGVHIPEGIDVGVPAYSIHHNESYFPNSHMFSPERWLTGEKDDKGDKELSVASKAYVPFSLGPFNCIGRHVAYLACKLVLAKMVYMYDIKKAGEKLVGEMKNNPGEYNMVDWLVGYRDGPVVQFRRREKA